MSVDISGANPALPTLATGKQYWVQYDLSEEITYVKLLVGYTRDGEDLGNKIIPMCPSWLAKVGVADPEEMWTIVKNQATSGNKTADQLLTLLGNQDWGAQSIHDAYAKGV